MRTDAPPACPARAGGAGRGHAYARGLAGEARAADLLERLGFVILARRARTPAGEIDLIARRGDLLVFCEVKVRATLVLAAEAVRPRQRQRIAAAAAAFLADCPELNDLDMRFDVVLVSTAGEIDHLPGAFDAGS